MNGRNPGMPKTHSKSSTREIDLFFEAVSSNMAPGLYTILNIYARDKLDMPFSQAIVRRPEETYKLMVSVLGENSVRLFDKVIAIFLRKKGIQSPASGILTSLKTGDLSPLEQVVSEYSRHVIRKKLASNINP